MLFSSEDWIVESNQVNRYSDYILAVAKKYVTLFRQEVGAYNNPEVGVPFRDDEGKGSFLQARSKN